MDKMRRSHIGPLVAALALAACGTSTASAPPNREGGSTPVTLTIATGNSKEELLAFKAQVDKLSGGTIVIDIRENWRQGEPDYEVGGINDVIAGKADLGLAAIRAFDKVGTPTFQGLMAPFLIDSHDLEARVIQSDLATQVLGGVRDVGLHGFGYQFDALRRPIGFTRDLVTLADYRGARIGIRSSEVSELTFKALGATPVVNPAGDRSGLDGVEGALGTAREYIEGGMSSITGNVVFWPRISVLFADRETWDRLSDTQQGILVAAGDAVLSETIPNTRSYQDELYGVLCRMGMTVRTTTDADRAELLRAVEPVYDHLEQNPSTKAVIAAIRDMRAPNGSPDAIEPCARAEEPSRVAGQVSPIDGEWVVSFTLDAVADSPLWYDRGEQNDGNWGRFRMTLDHGQVSFAQEDPAADVWSTTGTFTVTDDVVEFRYLEGGNQGETFHARWSLFEGTLQFQRDEALGILPTPYILRPWTKVG